MASETPLLCRTICMFFSINWGIASVKSGLTRYCLVGIAVIASGIIYWALWRVVPKWFGYKFVPRKETLSDGTVVAVVRVRQSSSLNED